MSHDCDRHSPGTLSCYYTDGCRCLPCAIEGSAYERQRVRGHHGLVPAVRVAKIVNRLRDRGWSYRAIADEAGVGEATVKRAVAGKVDHCQQRVWLALDALDVLPARPGRLPAAPLLDALDARAENGIRPLLGDADARTYYRSAHRGWVDEVWADRIACQVLGMPLPLLYGTDYHEEAA